MRPSLARETFEEISTKEILVAEALAPGEVFLSRPSFLHVCCYNFWVHESLSYILN